MARFPVPVSLSVIILVISIASALSSLRPCLFVCGQARGIRKLEAARGVEKIDEAIARGLLVVLFPEGTSSDGRDVLPFKSSLLESGARSPQQVTAGVLPYELRHGSVEYEVCYWRDLTLLPISAPLRALNCARRAM